MPPFIIPATTWSGFLVPTLEGQYFIKNILIIAAGLGFEPKFSLSESDVLPLHHPAINIS